MLSQPDAPGQVEIRCSLASNQEDKKNKEKEGNVP